MIKNLYVARTALIVALGGFLMGFDASVISGVVGFIEVEFDLSNLQLGWAVSSLTLSSTLAMLAAGPLSNRIGRRTVLYWAAVLYAVSAIGSALAPNYMLLVIAVWLVDLEWEHPSLSPQCTSRKSLRQRYGDVWSPSTSSTS